MTASVLIDLDTRGPSLTVEGSPPKRIEPPDTWIVKVRSSEDIGTSVAVVQDGLDRMFTVGLTRLDARNVEVRVPTIGLATGNGALTLRITDTVGNPTQVRVPLVIDRERAFDVLLTLSGAYDASLTQDRPYQHILEIGPLYQITLEVSR